jgi:hypothetical protein
MSEDDFSTRFLKKGRELYEQGDKAELLYCLHFCIINQVAIPPWLRTAFSDARYASIAYKIKSWDEVFGKPLKKGKRLATERRKMEIIGLLNKRIRDRHEAGEPLETLFREVGKDFGVGSTVAKELYYEMENDLAHTMNDEDTINRKWSMLPGKFKKTRKFPGRLQNKRKD